MAKPKMLDQLFFVNAFDTAFYKADASFVFIDWFVMVIIVSLFILEVGRQNKPILENFGHAKHQISQKVINHFKWEWLHRFKGVFLLSTFRHKNNFTINIGAHWATGAENKSLWKILFFKLSKEYVKEMSNI